jgi:hypothetical protein
MGSAWRPGLYDKAAWAASQMEEVDVDTYFDFEEILEEDNACLAWEKDMEVEIVV